MRATYNWIKEYVPDFKGDVAEMCERFTMSGTEVEYFSPCGDDFVIEFSVTSNRVDCLGVLGLARDLAAATGLPFVPPAVELDEVSEEASQHCSVGIEDFDLCSRYSARIIEGLKVGPSPAWMVARLEAIGLRSINNIVDATNYALFETNQPFHAFDLDRLKGKKIVVRSAKKGETIVALNDKEYKLDASRLVITDASGPIAIAGVMGGDATEVTDATTRVLLETAHFNQLSIRTTSKALGLSSDSSFRFERGVDAMQIERAAARCAQLIVEVAGGNHLRGLVLSEGKLPKPKLIPFRHAQVERITGIQISFERCLQILTALDCATLIDDPAEIIVTPPSWRFDLDREIDLVEEIIRNYGLESLPLESVMPVMTVKEPRNQKVRGMTKSVLVACGFQETLTTSFLPEKEAALSFFSKTAPLSISNAMRKDENALRQSLLHSLLAVRKTNQDHGNEGLRLFECTVVYLAHPNEVIPEHLPIVAALMDGSLREARGVVESLLASLGIKNARFNLPNADEGHLDPASAVSIQWQAEGVSGYMGRPRSATVEGHDLKTTPVYIELRLDHLTAAANLEPKYEALSRFPAVKRDLAVVVDQALMWSEIESLIHELKLANLDCLEFFDEYYGKQLEAGKKSLAFSLTYRSLVRTLTGDEVDTSQSRLVQALSERFGAQVRS